MTSKDDAGACLLCGISFAEVPSIGGVCRECRAELEREKLTPEPVRITPRFYSTAMMHARAGMPGLCLVIDRPFLIRRVYVRDQSGGAFDSCVVDVALNPRGVFVSSPVWLLKSPVRLLRRPLLAVADHRRDRWKNDLNRDWSIGVSISGGSIASPRLTGKDPDLTVYLDGDSVESYPDIAPGSWE